ncbi:uncharacterized protein LOC117100160 [Anneissia japonica]|uniref:uncharacterized protein LOC117100160 n=1 Tax=Anneissia japonica TaxID=1529436 RepID=UPI001425904E|nr:uncharacterized protein LOC117100160 [Anneissia japonica]
MLLNGIQDKIDLNQFGCMKGVSTVDALISIMLGPVFFIIFINDLKVHLPIVKYMDDTTVSEKISSKEPSTFKNVSEEICSWSTSNRMKINEKKTKEMLISCKHVKSQPPMIQINGVNIGNVSQSKLLGFAIQDDLGWESHIQSIVSKCNTRIYFLKQLRRCGLNTLTLRHYYCSVIRSVPEYACPLWFTGTTLKQQQIIETIQKRAIKCILPGMSYENALLLLGLSPLKDRLLYLSKIYFEKIKKSEHRLNHLLTPTLDHNYRLRNIRQFALPKIKCERTKKFIINYCIFHQW